MTFQHCGIIVVIYNIFSIISTQCDRVDKKLTPCWSVRADKPSPVGKHTLLLVTIFRARCVPQWSFCHEFYLEDIMVLILFYSRFSHLIVTYDFT